jgi:hypothetical protein
MTSIEWLIEEMLSKGFFKESVTLTNIDHLQYKAEELHKQEMAQLPQQEISDESWEGCDGCTEEDEIMYKNGYVKGYNAAIAELPKEISDEEIEKEIKSRYETPHYNSGFMDCSKWYREQLRKNL